MPFDGIPSTSMLVARSFSTIGCMNHHVIERSIELNLVVQFPGAIGFNWFIIYYFFHYQFIVWWNDIQYRSMIIVYINVWSTQNHGKTDKQTKNGNWIHFCIYKFSTENVVFDTIFTWYCWNWIFIYFGEAYIIPPTFYVWNFQQACEWRWLHIMKMVEFITKSFVFFVCEFLLPFFMDCVPIQAQNLMWHNIQLLRVLLLWCGYKSTHTKTCIEIHFLFACFFLF